MSRAQAHTFLICTRSVYSLSQWLHAWRHHSSSCVPPVQHQAHKATGAGCRLKQNVAVQALQATAAAEAERKANSSKARIELEEQMKERQILQQQQQVCVAMKQLRHVHLCFTVSCFCHSICPCKVCWNWNVQSLGCCMYLRQRSVM